MKAAAAAQKENARFLSTLFEEEIFLAPRRAECEIQLPP